MRYLLLFLVFGCYIPLFAQQATYQPFEVDSAAEPRGGIAFLNSFLQTNLRKPIAATAQGIGGRIVVSAIVEPDGSVSNVKVVNSLRPDCDREAIRKFSLFKAWKPGFKDGKAIRQQLTTTVLFKPNAPFIYRNGARINYFDADKNALLDSSEKARYKQVTPLDTNGFANGEIIVYKGKVGNWKEDYRIHFVRQVNDAKGSSAQSTITIGYQTDNQRWEGEVILLNATGAIVNQSFYENGQPTGAGMTYSPNGVVVEKTEEFEDRFVSTSWYPNGQIKQIRTNYKPIPPAPPGPEQVVGFWEKDGRQRIKNGTGYRIDQEDVTSYIDSNRKTIFTEQGTYENGVKQGTWVGSYADKSYFYEERYDKGVCQGGKARMGSADTVRYTELENTPEFKGGLPALGQFLSNQLRYPTNAQRARVQGKVLLSFVVNEEGNVEDIFVLKGIGFGADEEAQRVVKASSGHWTPGTQRGQKVRVKYNLPVNFTLN